MIRQNRELICIHHPDGRFKTVSDSSLSILGYTPAEMEGADPYDFIHPEDKGHTRSEVHNPALNGNMDSVTHLRYRRKDGRYIVLQTIAQPVFTADGKVEGLYTSSRDVTERQEQRHELEYIKRLFEKMSKMAGVGGWEYYPSTGDLHWTDEVYAIHEVPKTAKPKVEDGLSYYPGEARTKMEKALQKTINDHKPYLLELPFISAKGTHKWIRAYGDAHLSGGKLEFIYGAFQDITVQKLRELELEAKNKELRLFSNSLTQKNMQLEEFSQIIAHNLRAPVGNIDTLTHLLGLSKDTEEQDIYVQQIQESVGTLNETFEELMEVLKVKTSTSLKLKTIYVREEMDKILRLFTGSLKQASAKVQFELDAFECLRTSPVYFNSIFSNLISNAFKYRNPKIPLEMHVRNGYTDLGKPYITISDNGLGIDLDRYGNKIFKLRKTFHRHPDAKGFGLFMVKNQVEALGGSIEVQSKPKEGTTFTVYFKKQRDKKSA